MNPSKNTTSIYRGRFAPSPTGELHFGSMVAAVGSYLQARANQGQWLVRIEDLDPPREVKGAADSILRTLEQFGLHWDEEITYQSQRTEAYLSALEQLRRNGNLYPCGCTRKEVTTRGPFYTGFCRPGLAAGKQARALRILTHKQPIKFIDSLRGHFEQRLEEEVGDFIVRRADQFFAYQLAVVIDDAWQKISEVVRGSDLLDNTPRQIHLQQCLHYPQPSYVHLPIALNTLGQKLSKQSGAKSINTIRPQVLIIQILDFLQQAPPLELLDASLDEIWRWAITHWQLNKVPRHDLPTPKSTM